MRGEAVDIITQLDGAVYCDIDFSDIEAILEAQKRAGYAVVKLPEPDLGNDGRYVSTWKLDEHETVQVDVFRNVLYEGMDYTVAEARTMAAALLAAALRAES